MSSKLHIAKLATVYGQNAPVDTLCGRFLRRAVGHALWGLVGRNRKDKCSQCVVLYRKRIK
jgi:hypothetical protein